jgi:Flp pilus assembly protein TadB
MSREQLHTTYSERIEHFGEAIRQQTGKINLLSLARLAALVATVWFVVLGVKHHSLLFYFLSAGMVPLFLVLVSIYNRHKEQRELLRQLKSLNHTELSCLDHDYHSLPDGSGHADTAHPWSHDLDLFGTGSLFQYLNRTSTLKGEALLAGMLTKEPGSVENIHQRQEIIADLKERIEFRQKLTARGRLVQEKAEDFGDISQWLNSSAYIRKYRWLFFLAILVSTLTVTTIIWGSFNTSMFWFLLYLFVFNLTVLSPFLMRTNRYQVVISKKHQLLEGYAQLLKIIATQSFDHPELTSRCLQAQKGMKEVRKLSRLLNAFDQRLSMLLGLLFNGFFLFDFIMMYLLERWKEKNQQQILEWIELTGWIDAMVSLSGFAWNHPDFALPRVSKEEQTVEFTGLGHPLIPDEKRVSNDLSIAGEKVVVITGANMAGKSTFLRSLGVNMVLAYTGCPVCAQKFNFGYMGLYSSMRTADSLKDEESYFLAEIKKLQLIVQHMESGKPLMILLDEVLKGTNTTDKKRGSVGLIRKTLKYPVRCFIATHDLSLGELEAAHSGEVVNYCFESYIKDMVLSFDYTIRKGIATNMNASFLMKQMGIVD